MLLSQEVAQPAAAVPVHQLPVVPAAASGVLVVVDVVVAAPRVGFADLQVVAALLGHLLLLLVVVLFLRTQ